MMDLKNNILIPILLVVVLFLFTIFVKTKKDDKNQKLINEYEVNISNLQNKNRELMIGIDSLELRVFSLYREKTQLHLKDSLRELSFKLSKQKLKLESDSIKNLNIIKKNEFILNYIYK